MCKEHNHPLLENRNIASNHRLSSEMLEEIEFLVSVGCGAGPVICVLQKQFSDATINPKNVYNAICIFRRGQKVIKTDAAETYDKLMKLQREDHGWFVEARLEGDDNHLTGLFWMRPSQIELWQKFHDVAINDNTSQTNKYRMYLSLTIVVDNHARSRMAATAVVSDETKETYQWILGCLLRATNGLAPKVLFTDADPAIVVAIHDTLPTTKHNYCIWHLRRNLEKNLKGKLHNKYNDFVKEWNQCRNSFSEEEFRIRWRVLLAHYSEARKYLERALGTDVTNWALCFTHRSFNAGIQSTQHVKSYNALIKKSVKSSTTLYELDIQIQLQLDKEEQFERLQEQSNQNPTVGLPNVIGRYFRRIDSVVKKYLTPQVLKMQRRQMNESLLYRVKNIKNWEHLMQGQSANKEREQSDDEEERSDEESDDEQEPSDEEREQSDEQFDDDDNERQEGSGDEERENAGMKQKDNKVKFAEDDYESKISNLRSLIRYLDQAIIHEIWSVTTIEQNKEHFVILYGNGNHLCTCMLLVTKGLVCRHFFSVMLSSDKAMFHVGLIPTRWYHEILSSSQEEPAITICSDICRDKPVYEHQIRTNFNLLNEIHHMHLFLETVMQNLSHKAKYNRGFGYAKKAIELSLDVGCEDEINGILQGWIKKKESEIHGRNLESNKENLPNISNPHQTRTKGAPKKRIKNALERATTKSRKQAGKRQNKPNTLPLSHPSPLPPPPNEFPRELQEITNHKTKYICSYCKGSGHNSRSCKLKKH